MSISYKIPSGCGLLVFLIIIFRENNPEFQQQLLFIVYIAFMLQLFHFTCLFWLWLVVGLCIFWCPGNNSHNLNYVKMTGSGLCLPFVFRCADLVPSASILPDNVNGRRWQSWQPGAHPSPRCPLWNGSIVWKPTILYCHCFCHIAASGRIF